MKNRAINRFLRFGNRVFNRIERLFRVRTVRSCPPYYALGITNVCNLRCPLCVTGKREQKKQLRFMEMELFADIIGKISRHACLVQLYRWGEPLLHPQLIDMLELCSKHDLNTEISTNFSLPGIDAVITAMVRHRLRHLIVSMDGADHEHYVHYRQGGDFELVVANLNKLKREKERTGSQFPVVTLQYLTNRFSETQAEILQEKYRDFGGDRLCISETTTPFGDSDHEKARTWLTDTEIERRVYLDVDSSLLGKRCHFLYDFMIIEQDGSIPPCCYCSDPADDFSQWVAGASIQKMYNSPRFIQARELFNHSASVGDVRCSSCSILRSCRPEDMVRNTQ